MSFDASGVELTAAHRLSATAACGPVKQTAHRASW